MKVEHITYKGNSVIRDTNDVLPSTVKHFKAFQEGSVTEKIERTNFTCKVTVADNIALFDLIQDGIPFCTSFCCFNSEDKEAVMLYLKDLLTGIEKKPVLPIHPKLDKFIYTVIIRPINSTDAMTAGEIELYIYDAIYRGMLSRVE